VGRITTRKKKWIAAVSVVVAIVFLLVMLFTVEDVLSIYLSEVLLTVLLIVMVPSAVADIIHSHWMNGIESQMPALVRGVSEVQETGMTFIKGFERVVDDGMIKSPLAQEVKKLTVNMSWGLTFETALERFRDRIGSPVVNRFCALLLEADRSGGEVRKVFTATAGFMEEMKELEQETTSQMRPYVVIIYAAYFVYIFTSIVLLNSFFKTLVDYNDILNPTTTMSIADYNNFFYRTMIISGVMGGLMSGKIGERRVLGGLKHSIIQLVVGYAIFFVAMPPNWVVVPAA
jgi:flagellar protein FlaJ